MNSTELKLNWFLSENGVSSKDILEIIGKHNEVRHLVAKGELPRQPRSVKMPNLVSMIIFTNKLTYLTPNKLYFHELTIRL